VSLPNVMGEFRVVADPELRFAPSGVAVCKMRAVASSRKKVNDEWVDDKNAWVNITTFKKSAENAAETYQKGDLITVCGRLQTEDWEDKDGNKRTSVDIVADSIGAATTWTSARIARAERSGSSSGGGAQRSSGGSSDPDPWATPADDAPPF
jgi:single-strand DNA-binding protein